jgi:hypothetical protein
MMDVSLRGASLVATLSCLLLAGGAGQGAQAQGSPPAVPGASLGLIAALTVGANATAENRRIEAGLPVPAAAKGKPKTCPSGFRYNPHKEICHKLYCVRGRVWSLTSRRCESFASPRVHDSDLYLEGLWFSAVGRRRDAIGVFDRIWNKINARIMNAMGETLLREGDPEKSVAYLAQAATLDPKDVKTHANLGEGYARLRKIGHAKAERVEVEKRGGYKCKEYVALNDIIARAEAARTAVREQATQATPSDR